MSREMRLNKALARAGICSRRRADGLVFSGRVKVNDEVVREPGIRVDPEKDSIIVDGRPVKIETEQERELVHVMLNKPVQVVTTTSDPGGRAKVTDLLPDRLRRMRLFPVGRLDYFSRGLLILTNDGDLAHSLTHPSRKIPKVYRVKMRGDLSKKKLQIMRRGMVLSEGEKLAPVEVKILQQTRDSVLAEMTLVQGINRQIRRMCRDLDMVVLSLVRIRQGPLALGELKPGEWRYLEPGEVSQLRKWSSRTNHPQPLLNQGGG
ncbi:RNA-binding S4 domain protein [Desulfonatronospira thiodismutans ASO3-1]|uniref:Pseudouridine synthase n=2 Tax=Desulfonatronospira thiodismutans TaxID=488939 RepID=D6SQB3_9BACT|nr:RNA-binding S4 domain protein [Desulfonatronospira thiodismutans ASO3-1]